MPGSLRALLTVFDLVVLLYIKATHCSMIDISIVYLVEDLKNESILKVLVTSGNTFQVFYAFNFLQ